MKIKQSTVALMALSLSFGALGQSDRDRSSIDAFVARKATQSATRIEALSQLGRATSYESLLLCARQLQIRPSGFPSTDPMQQAALLSTFQKDVVMMTLTAGLPLGQCDSTATRNALNAAARILRGDSSTADLVRLSDFVVIAVARPSPVRVDQDGFRSSIGFVVTRSLQGDLNPGEKFVVRQMSGKEPDGSEVSVSSEPKAVHGTKYLVVGSRSNYDVVAAEHGKRKQGARSSVPIAMAYMLVDPGAGEADNIRLATRPL